VGVLYQVTLIIKPQAEFGGRIFFKVFFLVADIAEQFEIIEVQRYFVVADVIW